jgi:hypothetical protein
MLKRGFQERTLLGTSLTHYKPRAHHTFETPEAGDRNGNGRPCAAMAPRRVMSVLSLSLPLGANAITAVYWGGDLHIDCAVGLRA